MKLVKVFFATLALTLVGGFVQAQTTFAAPNDIPNSIRPALVTYDSVCSGIPEKYAIYTWISVAGQPTQTSLTVPYGTTSVDLQFNRLVFVCRQLAVINGATYPGLPQDGTVIAGAVTSNMSQVVGGFIATNGTLQNTASLTALSTIFRSATTRYWMSTPQPFTYQPNSPLIASQNIQVGFDAKQANVFSFTTIGCINPPGPGGSVPSLNNCNNGLNIFDIAITVGPPPPPPAASLQGFVIAPGGAAVGGSTIHVQNVGTSTANPFTFASIPVDPAPRLFFIGPIPAGFTVAGSNICRNTGSQPGIPQCTGAPGFSNPNGQGWAAGASRSIDFQSGINYDVRWIVQPTFTCDMVFAPNYIDPLSPFTITGTATGPAMATAYGLGANQMIFDITGPVNQSRTVNPTTLSGTTVTGTASFTPLGVAGTYTVAMRLGGVFAGGSCNTQIRIVSFMPTFTARNADIVAGMTLPYADNGVCAAPDTSAGIVGWNQAQSTTPDFIGSGGNLGAMVLNAIQGYATGTGGTGGGGTGGGVSFANSPAASYSYTDDTGRFGGDLRAFTTSCSADYYAQRLTESPLSPMPGSALASWDGAYQATGDVSFGGGNLPTDRHVRLYVDGNVRITGNVSFSFGSTDLSNRNRIPSLWIIATGNIYVDQDVTEINAILVAQGTSTDPDSGAFHSCDTDVAPFTSFVAGVTPYNYGACSANTLTVNGSVIARRLVLTRSYGTIGSTVPQTYAEIFNYSPLTWLSPTGIGGSPTSSSDLNNEYQSITSLPPVL
jgi:hypothetical protein